MLNEIRIFTPRERFTHALGTCYRTEIDVADGARGWWQIEDLDGNEICAITDEGSRWRRCTPLAGISVGDYLTFEDALNTHLALIQSTGGN